MILFPKILNVNNKQLPNNITEEPVKQGNGNGWHREVSEGGETKSDLKKVKE